MSDYGKHNTVVKIGQLYDWVTGGQTPTAVVTANLHQRINTWFASRGNPQRNGVYIDGGNFASAKRDILITPSAELTVFRPGYGKAYVGSYTVAPSNPSMTRLQQTAQNAADAELDAQGAKAWNRLRPDLPDFTLATSLGELKDMPGMLKDAVKGIRDAVKHAGSKGGPKGGKSSASKAGQYYLALQFGWLPLLKDIQNFVKAQQNGQKRLAQLIRDNGKPVKRQVNISHSQSYDWTSYNEGTDGWGGNLGPSHVTQCYKRFHGTYRNLRGSSTSRTWAEGVFRYHLPPGPRTVVWRKKMLRRIMGSRVTPDTIYNLMPWTWLVDYFTDLGQFVQAISPGVADRLAADYAYSMKTEQWTETREANSVFQGALANNTKYVEAVCYSSVVDTCKRRRRASPFGWGVKQESLTPKQLAILGALGLSKLP